MQSLIELMDTIARTAAVDAATRKRAQQIASHFRFRSEMDRLGDIFARMGVRQR